MGIVKQLQGEGDRRVVEKVRVRRKCDYCGEPAFYQNTYLNDGERGARKNPASKAYGRGDCTFISDYDDYLCPSCHHKSSMDNVPDGFGWCSTFQADRLPHLFLVWEEREIEREDANPDLSQFEGM